ncbi:MAG TPA: ABC transporter ATP-binding protein [Holophagaceae bacterium]|nr:ABC transporter ATP-binding protein [Holophagaceae bacterium]
MNARPQAGGRGLEAKALRVPGRLEDVSFALPAGCLAAVVGPNGAGKSTLLQALAGLLPCEGEVGWLGESLSKIPALDRGRRLAWVPQELRAEFGFPVRDVVAMGRFAHGDDEAGVDAALDRMDLRALQHRPLTRISGGERQRAFLARALTTEAPLQLWDEPLSQLDVRHQLELLELAKSLSVAGGTVLMSVHDLRVAHCMDRVLMLSGGRLAAAGAPEEVLTPERVLAVFGVRARVGETLILDLP